MRWPLPSFGSFTAIMFKRVAHNYTNNDFLHTSKHLLLLNKDIIVRMTELLQLSARVGHTNLLSAVRINKINRGNISFLNNYGCYIKKYITKQTE